MGINLLQTAKVKMLATSIQSQLRICIRKLASYLSIELQPKEDSYLYQVITNMLLEQRIIEAESKGIIPRSEVAHRIFAHLCTAIETLFAYTLTAQLYEKNALNLCIEETMFNIKP